MKKDKAPAARTEKLKLKSGKTSWCFVIDLYVDGKRKPMRRSGFSTKNDAKQAMTEALEAIKAAKETVVVKKNQQTFAEYIIQWFDEQKREKYRYNTSQVNEVFIKTHIIPSIGDVLMDELTVETFEKLKKDLSEKKLALGTRRRIYLIASSALTKAIKKKKLTINYAQLAEAPPTPPREKKQTWNEEQIRLFLDVAKNDRLFLAFRLALLTGMRRAEILGLSWEGVNFNSKTIKVTQTLSKDGTHIMEGAKSVSSIRSIAVDPLTIELLQKHKRVMQSELSHLDIPWTEKITVLCTGLGTPISPRNLSRTWYRLLRKSGLWSDEKKDRITFHGLRHTHATEMLRLNISVNVASERLGHSRPSITRDVYQHTDDVMQRDAAELIGSKY